MLTNRFATWRAIFADRWVGWLTGIYGFLCFLDFVRAHILPATYHGIWDKWYVLPDLSLKTWAIIGLVVVVVILLEGSYELVRQHQVTIEGLRSDLREAQQIRDDRAKRSEIITRLGLLLLRDGNTALDEFVASGACVDSHQKVIQWLKSTYAYLQDNLGIAQAEAFRSQPPVMGTPDNFPLKNGGTYQAMRGWLLFLGGLVSRLSSN